MLFQTKEEIAAFVSQTRFLVDTINRLIGNLENLCNTELKANRAGLYNHLKNIQGSLVEAGRLFNEQIELYNLLAEQSAQNNVAGARETLGRIKRIGDSIIMVKGRLHYQAKILPQFLIVYGATELPALAAIQKELELIAG